MFSSSQTNKWLENQFVLSIIDLCFILLIASKMCSYQAEPHRFGFPSELKETPGF